MSWLKNKQVTPPPKPPPSKSQVQYYLPPLTPNPCAAILSPDVVALGQATLKILRIPVCRKPDAGPASWFPNTQVAKEDAILFMYPCTNTPFVSLYRNQTEPVLSGNALFTVSSIGIRSRLPKARQCRNCARGRAASGGALSMPSSAERGPRPPLASPPPRLSSPGGCNQTRLQTELRCAGF